jgi:outer membrane protein
MKKLSKPTRWTVHSTLGLLFVLGAANANAIDLVGAYEQALQNDPTSLAANDALAAGREKAVQGDALVRPRVNLQAGVSRMHVHSSSDASSAFAALAPADSTGTVRQTAVEVVQPLYDKTATATRRQLHEQSALAQTQFDQSRQNLAMRVADTYFGVVVAEETLRVVQAEQAALRQQRDRAKARFEIGQGRITDLNEAQARLDGVESREISAQSSLELRNAQFRETIGASPAQLVKLTPSFVARLPEPNDLLTWQAKGEDQNSLIKARQNEFQIAGAEIDKYRLANRPNLALVGRYATSGQSGNLSPLAASSGRTGTIGLQLNIPLYAGGGLDSREREAVAKRSQAEQEVAAARRGVRLKVQDGFLAVKTGVSRIAAAEQAMVSARSALEATTLGRDVGSRTELDVLDAQQRFHGAELDLVQARVDYLLGRLRLADAAGELNEGSLRSLSLWLGS